MTDAELDALCDSLKLGSDAFAYRDGADRVMDEAADAIATLRSERDALRKVATAASHALRSYQYGNSATELAESTADAIDAALLAGKKP